jgi:hypothetical protein
MSGQLADLRQTVASGLRRCAPQLSDGCFHDASTANFIRQYPE